MEFMSKEKEVLEKYLPGLIDCSKKYTLSDIEREGGPAVSLFKNHGGPALLIPTSLGGLGLNMLNAVRIHRAIAYLSPSMAIAATMHNFSSATLIEYSMFGDETKALLEQVAEHKLLIASGFAEGRSGADILKSAVKAKKVANGYCINGNKKPCSLSRSFDVLTAGVSAEIDSSGGARRAVAVIHSETEGISVNKFWNSSILTGAESEELVLDNVFVADENIFFPQSDTALDVSESKGFIWFELLVTSSYVGMASALVDRVLKQERGSSSRRAALVAELEMAMSALEGFALAMQENEFESLDAAFARILHIRYSIQSLLDRVVNCACELLGGMAYIGSNDIIYLSAACRALVFHPPSRLSMANNLDGFINNKIQHLNIA